MAPSRPAPVDEPPSASSSEEEEEEEESEETMLNQKPTKDLSEDEEEEEEGDEEEEDEGEEETDDDEEIPQAVVNKPNDKKPIPTQSSLPLESEDEEEEEGTESDDFDMQSVPSPSISNFTIKPNTTSKTVDHSSTKSKKSSGKADPLPPLHPTTTTSIITTQARSSTKRPLETSKDNGNGSPKKRKGISSNGAEEKSGSNRLWSENDQIAILKGMIDYQSNKGADPLADAAAFHDMMKKSLNVDVSRGQMVDKIRRMRKKYLNNAEKGVNGQDPVFAKPYESQSFELSKRIWGVDKVSNGDSSSSRKKTKKKVKTENPQNFSQDNGNMDVEMKEEAKEKEVKAKEEIKEEDEEDFWNKYPLLEKSLSDWAQVESPVLGEEFGKKAMKSIGNSNAKELEEKWRKLKVEEIELYMKKMDLIYQQTKMIQQTLK